jgi:hypothetical protein
MWILSQQVKGGGIYGTVSDSNLKQVYGFG